MTSPYDIFKTDATTETEGLVLDYGDFQIRIARAGGSSAESVRPAMPRSTRSSSRCWAIRSRSLSTSFWRASSSRT